MDLTKAELLALVAMAFGVFMDGLDSSIVNIALPSIAESFGTDTSTVAWVTITYMMMIAGLMLTFGRISDSGHIRKVYVLGFALFTGASMLCGLSQDLWMLVGARVVQGTGAAMLGAVAPMICVRFVSGSRLGLAMSILMLSGAVGFASGPAIGGFIVDISSWHWAFFINIPVGILAILFALRALPKDHDISKAKLDLKGSLLLFLAVISGVYILEMFSQEGQSLICMILAMVMVVSAVLFIMIEKRVDHPMLNVRMFRNWRFDSSLLCYFIMMIAYMGISYIIPFYLTMELDLSYSFAGLLILIPSIVTITLSIPSGHYGDVHGRRGLCILCTIIMIMYATGCYILKPDMGWLPFIPLGILGGIMWGLCGNVMSRVVDLSADDEKAIASTLSNFVYYTGASIGTALFASLVTFGSGSAGVPIGDLSVEAFMEGYTFAMLIAIPLSFIGLICAWIINENKVRTS